MQLRSVLVLLVLLCALFDAVAGQRSNGFPTYDDHPSPFRFNRPIATRKPRLDLKVVKQDILAGIVECEKRCLLQCTKWLAELNHGLADTPVELRGNSAFENVHSGIEASEYDSYLLAKSYFLVREYDRSAYFTRN
uniref:Cdc23 domain-containing protein n=1 Tax=Anopheles coluzzii TaxID=1518534 RepID=A0A8W7PMG0_ANOCL